MIKMNGINSDYKMNNMLKTYVYISLRLWFHKAVIKTIGIKVNKLSINSKANKVKLIYNNSPKLWINRWDKLKLNHKMKNKTRLLFIIKAESLTQECLLSKFTFQKGKI